MASGVEQIQGGLNYSNFPPGRIWHIDTVRPPTGSWGRCYLSSSSGRTSVHPSYSSSDSSRHPDAGVGMDHGHGCAPNDSPTGAEKVCGKSPGWGLRTPTNFRPVSGFQGYIR